MSAEIAQHLGIIANAVKRIEELLGFQDKEPTPQPAVVTPTPVPGMRIQAQTAPVTVPSVSVSDSYQTALSNWKSNVHNFSTIKWIESGMPNWVDSVDPNSSDEAVGCAMAFVSYLLHQGMTLEAVTTVSSAGSTPAQAYQALNQGMVEQAWPVFSGVMRALGGRVGSSDPFNMAHAAHTPRPIQHV